MAIVDRRWLGAIPHQVDAARLDAVIAAQRWEAPLEAPLQAAMQALLAESGTVPVISALVSPAAWWAVATRSPGVSGASCCRWSIR